MILKSRAFEQTLNIKNVQILAALGLAPTENISPKIEFKCYEAIVSTDLMHI